jgi:hypothetical protein
MKTGEHQCLSVGSDLLYYRVAQRDHRIVQWRRDTSRLCKSWRDCLTGMILRSLN